MLLCKPQYYLKPWTPSMDHVTEKSSFDVSKITKQALNITTENNLDFKFRYFYMRHHKNHTEPTLPCFSLAALKHDFPQVSHLIKTFIKQPTIWNGSAQLHLKCNTKTHTAAPSPPLINRCCPSAVSL